MLSEVMKELPKVESGSELESVLLGGIQLAWNFWTLHDVELVQKAGG